VFQTYATSCIRSISAVFCVNDISISGVIKQKSLFAFILVLFRIFVCVLHDIVCVCDDCLCVLCVCVCCMCVHCVMLCCVLCRACKWIKHTSYVSNSYHMCLLCLCASVTCAHLRVCLRSKYFSLHSLSVSRVIESAQGTDMTENKAGMFKMVYVCVACTNVFRSVI